MNAHDMLQVLDLDDDTVTDPDETFWAWLSGFGLALTLLGLTFQVFGIVVSNGHVRRDDAGWLLGAWCAVMVGFVVRTIASVALDGIDLRAGWLRDGHWARTMVSPAGVRLRRWASEIAHPRLAAQVRRLAALVIRSQSAWVLPSPITMRFDTPLEGSRLGPLVDEDVPYIGTRHVVIAWPLADDCYVSFAIDEDPRMSHWEVFDAGRDLVHAIGPLAARDVPIEDLLRRAAEGV